MGMYCDKCGKKKLAESHTECRDCWGKNNNKPKSAQKQYNDNYVKNTKSQQKQNEKVENVKWVDKENSRGIDLSKEYKISLLVMIIIFVLGMVAGAYIF